MKRTIAALILSFSLAIPTFAANWWTVAQDLSQSVYRLSMVADGEEVGMCSGFVIDQRVSNILTAAHCAPEGVEVQVADQVGNVLLKDEDVDLAVIQYRGQVLGKALRPGKAPRTTDEIMSVGYAFGSQVPVFQIGRVAQSDYSGYIVVNPAHNVGMSGGPVVDPTGKVVGIVQASRGSLGAGKNIDEIRKVTRKYWQYDR